MKPIIGGSPPHGWSRRLLVVCLGVVSVIPGLASFSRAERPAHVRHPWPALIAQAEARGLPTGFLKEIAPDFVDVVFEDLRTYAAEYHPERHQMILNLRLSFNEAGGALADLTRMTHHDLGLLYHELLHAYLDYLFSASDPTALSPRAQRALALAKALLHCHYRFVRINPIRQRRTATELRFLSDEDAWEVLNETWAVFVGWAIWTKLELFHGQAREGTWTPELLHEWRTRLEAAHRSGELLGYYEPDDPEERRIARKRFIAPTNGLTPQEAEFLLREILEEPRELADIAKAVLAQKVTDETTPSCE